MQGDWTVIRDVVPQTLRHMRNSEIPATPFIFPFFPNKRLTSIVFSCIVP